MDLSNWPRTSTRMPAIEVVRKEDLESAADTEGMERLKAFENSDTTVVELNVPGDTVSDWHHHGDHHVYGYLVEGTARLEYRDDDVESVTCNAGDFFHVEPNTPHRDINPTDKEKKAIVTFVGSGPMAVDVDESE